VQGAFHRLVYQTKNNSYEKYQFVGNYRRLKIPVSQEVEHRSNLPRRFFGNNGVRTTKARAKRLEFFVALGAGLARKIPTIV
jgi:hypothetical protein